LTWKTVLQRFLDLLSDILSRPWRLSSADEDFVLIPKMLHDALSKSYLTQGLTHLTESRWLAEAQLQQCATAKINTFVKAPMEHN